MRRMERYVSAGDKRLRLGYTTGTCAAAASAAATELLLTGRAPDVVTIEVPAGITVTLDVESAQAGLAWASCSVIKDAGDDADMTDGVEIVSRVRRAPGEGVTISGGEGVGRVTMAGLDQPPGEAAINSVPRRMCEQAVRTAAEKARYAGGLEVEISIPGGAELAARTFNPRLGITGGLSVLGTTGLVRPMSSEALADALCAELSVVRATGATDLTLVPGAFGERYCREVLGLADPIVSCSNLIGVAVDEACRLGFETLLVVGHAGKLLKVAAGIWNTHSRVADGRAEVVCTHAALAGADAKTLRALLALPTTDAMVDLLAERGLLEATAVSIASRLEAALERRAGVSLRCGALVFTHERCELLRTTHVTSLIEHHRRREAP